MKKLFKQSLLCVLIALLCMSFFACNKKEERMFTVSFESNGGEELETVATKIINDFPLSFKEGYILEGWYTKSDFSDKPIIFPFEPVQDIVLYARWYSVQSGSPYLGFTLDAETDTYIVTSYTGKSHLIAIPQTYEDKDVTAIADGAFNVCDTVLTINIPYSIKDIGRAFFRCNNLQTITVSSKNNYYKAIDGVLYSFDEKSLISYPPAKTGDAYNILPTVTAIENSALSFNGYLKEIIISENVERIEKYFNGCYNLQKISVNADNNFYKSIDGVLYDKSGKTLLRYPQNSTNNDYIMPSGIESISEDAFNESKIETITIPASLKSFAYVKDCKYLIGFLVDNENHYYKSIEGVLFDKLGEKLVQYPRAKKGKGYKYDGMENDFYSYNIPLGVINIGSWAFDSCTNLNKIIIPPTLKKISEYAFSNIEGTFKLLEVICEEKSELENIGDFAFMDCSDLQKIEITAIYPPNLGSYVFNAVNEDFEIYVPNNAFELYENSQWNSLVKELSKGNNEKIFTTTFYTNGGSSLDNIKEIYIENNIVTTRQGFVFGGWYENALLIGESVSFPLQINTDTNLYAKWYISTQGTSGIVYTLQNDTDTYAVSGYTGSDTTVAVPTAYNDKIVTSVAVRAFEGKINIKSIILPETIIEINDSAFAGRYDAIMRLDTIEFNGQQLKSIGNEVFSYCQKLNNINLPATVKTIGNRAFNNCVSLENIILPQMLELLGFNVFSGCTRLKGIDIGTNAHFSSMDGVLYNGDKTVLIRYPVNKLANTFALPETIRSISSEAFSFVKYLTTISLNEGLTEIGTKAFSDCIGLKSIKIPSSMNSVNPSVFQNTFIKDITLSANTKVIEENFNGLYSLENIFVDNNNTVFTSIDGVLYSKDAKTVVRCPINKKGKLLLDIRTKQIGEKAFHKCLIDEVELNDGLNKIGNNAFEGCSQILTISLPETVSTIGDEAFLYASNLRAVFILSSNTYPSVGNYAFAGVTSNFIVYAPEEIVDEFMSDSQWGNFDIVSNTVIIDGLHLLLIDDYYKLIKVYSNSKEITIPSSINGVDITRIGKDVFSSKIRRINLPSTIERIESYAFTSNIDSNLTSIVFEEESNLIQIGANAFDNCRMLTSLVLGSETPPNILGESTILELAKHLKIYVPNTTEYQNSVYAQLPLFNRNIIVDNFAIEDNEDGIKIIGYIGTDNEIAFPTTINSKDVVALGEYIINPTIQGVTIPNTITELANNVFSFEIYGIVMALKTLNISSNNLVAICDNAFNGLAITEIDLPETLATISPRAFANCNELRRITVSASNSYFKSVDGVLFNAEQSQLIKYPAGRANLEYTLPQGVEIIGEYAFEEARNLTIINLNDDLVAVNSFAFKNCYDILDIKLPSGLLRIESYAFKGCTKINELYLPASLEKFNATAILECKTLSIINASDQNENYVSIDGVIFDKNQETLISYPVGKSGLYTIPSTTKKIAPYAFYLTTMSNLVIPNEVVEIGEFAFSNSKLKSITFGEGTTTLPKGAIMNCEKLENLFLPDTVESIGESFAEGCVSLRNFTFPSTISSIGERAFADCRRITNIDLPNGLTSLGAQAFNDCISLTIISFPSLITVDSEVLKGATALNSIKMGVKNTINKLFGTQQGVIPNSLKNIIIKEGVSTLPEGFFSFFTAIEKVDLPSTLMEIKKNAFYECLSLKNVEIKGVSMLERIDERAFWNCKELVMLRVNKKEPPRIGENVFMGDYNGNQVKLEKLKVYVPEAYVDRYQDMWEVSVNSII